MHKLDCVWREVSVCLCSLKWRIWVTRLAKREYSPWMIKLRQSPMHPLQPTCRNWNPIWGWLTTTRSSRLICRVYSLPCIGCCRRLLFEVVPEVIKTIGTLRPPTGTDITKPIESLFNKKKPIPTMTVARIQRWALTLAAYKYTIEYKPGAQISESIAYHPSNSFACWTLVGKETEVKIGLSISWSGQKSACPLVCSEREAWLGCEAHREGRRRGVR